VSQIVTFDQALAVNAQIPATNLDTIAAWIKANPQRGTFGSPGEGTGAHLAHVVRAPPQCSAGGNGHYYTCAAISSHGSSSIPVRLAASRRL
jgi:hypothetical protein